MRSHTKPLNSIALDVLQRNNQIACRHCYDAVMSGRGRTVLDDSGTLAITAWTCASCGGVIEEVRIVVQGRKAHPRPIRTPRRRDTRSNGQCRLRTRAQDLKWNGGIGRPEWYEYGAQPIGHIDCACRRA